MTFSPCCKWVLIESKGGGGVLEEGWRWGRGEECWRGVGVALAGGQWGIGWKSQQWKWQCSEREAWLHWDSMREGAACSSQSELHKEKVLLSISNGPLDNHTGTKVLYLTLIAKTAAPPISEPHDSPTSPCHLPAYSQDPFLNGIYNHPSSISTLIDILRLALCIRHLVPVKCLPWLLCLLQALKAYPSQFQQLDRYRMFEQVSLSVSSTWMFTLVHVHCLVWETPAAARVCTCKC